MRLEVVMVISDNDEGDGLSSSGYRLLSIVCIVYVYCVCVASTRNV